MVVSCSLFVMRLMRRWMAGWALAFLCATALATEPYQLLTEIPIGGEGGWDILTIDSGATRLFLSHTAKVVVVDLDKNTVVGEIGDTPGVHALVAVPELQRGFSSNGKESKSSVVDLKTLNTISKIDTGANPDAIVYEPRRGEVYIFNHTGNSATVIDATKHEVIARWSLAPGEEPSGIALDARHHRLFAGCHNKMMVMLDTETGKVIATVPIGAGVDGCAFDDATQLAFASCGEGTTTIAKEETPDKLTVVQTLKTERGARTMALDPKTHRIYLPSAQFQPPPSPPPGASPARPTIVPNTLKLLVYGPTESAKH